MRILEKLWSGSITPSVRKITPSSEQYKLTEYIARHESALESMLSDEALELFEKLKENQEELSSFNECEAFISGFQLGAKIILEVMESIEASYIDD